MELTLPEAYSEIKRLQVTISSQLKRCGQLLDDIEYWKAKYERAKDEAEGLRVHISRQMHESRELLG